MLSKPHAFVGKQETTLSAHRQQQHMMNLVLAGMGASRLLKNPSAVVRPIMMLPQLLLVAVPIQIWSDLAHSRG